MQCRLPCEHITVELSQHTRKKKKNNNHRILSVEFIAIKPQIQ